MKANDHSWRKKAPSALSAIRDAIASHEEPYVAIAPPPPPGPCEGCELCDPSLYYLVEARDDARREYDDNDW